MDKRINAIIKKFSDNELALNKIVVSAYIRANGLESNCGFISSFVIDTEDSLYEDVEVLSKDCQLEDVINIFELAIPNFEKTTNGAVYTPKFIREYIVSKALESTPKPLGKCLCADISCGCGAFLYTLSEQIHSMTNIPYKNILHNIYGIDISETSIGRAKILLALVALQNGEIVESEDFNLFCGDTLAYDFSSWPVIGLNQGMDIIVGNPPYVRSKNISLETKQYLSSWNTSKVGNADLYIPFFEIGMSILNETGVLGYITVNTFFKSVNARALRSYLSENQWTLKIVDFGEQLVFKKKLAYTCLAFLSKANSSFIQYSKAAIDDVKHCQNFPFWHISYSDLDNKRGWNLNDTKILKNIQLIENVGEPLGNKYVIKNGIATLANDVFIFRPIKSDAEYFYIVRNGIEYSIERKICRDIIKPNIIKTEADIPQKEEKIIFPYDEGNNVVSEKIFMEQFPCAYHYLCSCRDILDARDKGEGDYGAWFAFGRTQAIADKGRKLLFPYMSDVPHFVYTNQKDMMIYCGYAIYNESERELLFLKKILESSVFDYYMRNTGKPYSTGYYSYAKNYVKNFGIFPFSEEQKRHLMSLQTKEEIDAYLLGIYEIAI